MSRGSIVGLADLVRILGVEPDPFKDVTESPVLLRRAAQLGYDAEPRKTQLDKPEEAPEKAAQALAKDEGKELQSGKQVLQVPEIPETPFWIATSFFEREPIERFEPKRAAAPVTWTEAPKAPPEQVPLEEERSLRARLRSLLAPLSEGREIDVSRMVRRVARGDLISDPPLKARRRWPARVLVLLDVSMHLAPFFPDQNRLLRLLTTLMHGATLRCEHVDGAAIRQRPAQLADQLQILDEETVLLLGDLGSLSASHREVAPAWVEFGRALQTRAGRVASLTVGPAALIEASLRQLFRVEPWEAATRWAETDREKRNEVVERLLTLASHATRIQPGLLRDLRTRFEPDADAGIEAAFWDHAALGFAGASWAEMHSRAKEEYQARFAQLDLQHRQEAARIILSWKHGLKDGVAFQEMLSLGEGVVGRRQAAEARAYFADLGARYGLGDDASSFDSISMWVERMSAEASAALRTQREIEHLIAIAHERDHLPVLPDIDPAAVKSNGETGGAVRLTQTGGMLSVALVRASEDNASLLCEAPSNNGVLRILPLETADGVAPERLAPTFSSPIPETVRIPAGRFLMGSPESEPERSRGEDPQHEVEIAAFELGKYAVTFEEYDAFCEATGREKPDDIGWGRGRRPVINVSWEDAQAYVAWLREETGEDWRLPSEAEWEYACRAGTTTPFWQGDTITTDQANFDGNFPYAGGAKGAYRQQTVEVDAFAPNRFGLHQMHGNVWEWCQDHFHDSYEGAPSDGSAWEDAAAGGAAARVIRGGSWFDVARKVRAAFRNRGEPQNRRASLGFRCARGRRELQSGQQERLASASGERSRPMRTSGAAPVVLELGRSKARARPEAEALVAQSDRAEILLERLTRPSWADALGRDRFGLYAEIAVEDVRQRLRWIPPGVFMRGSPEEEPGRYDDEGPQHLVRIEEGFWLFSTPVTQGLYEAVTGENPSAYKSPDRPVESVSWDEAQAFIAALNGRAPGLDLRLPSEAEWEYACRAGTSEATYTGPMQILGANNAPVLDEIAWYGGNSGVGFELEDGHDSSDWPEKQYEHAKAGTRPVGLKKPNAWGLYDTLGNVWEWCADHWHENYSGAPDDGSAWEDADADGAASRVFRGGSWGALAREVRAAVRGRFEPQPRDGHLGFRCARGRSEPGRDGKGASAAWRGRSRASQPTRPAAEARRPDEPQGPIPWAEKVDRDAVGLYADIAVDVVRQRLRWIGPGRFLMGSPESEEGRYDDEGPRHEVALAEGFWLFDTPVTQALYEAVIGANPSRFKGADRPVEQVSFEDAEAFLARINARAPGLGLILPSEAQWEYACRAGSETAYCFGNAEEQLGDYAWYSSNSDVETHPVRQKQPNDWGLYDMHGNVDEWCADHWHNSYEGAPNDGDAWLDADADSAALRVIRGGSWSGYARQVRAAVRGRGEPLYRDVGLGFRCARGRSEPSR